MARHLGVVPDVAGLSREEVLALAALARRPLGLRSARAVARVAGISPTVAARALARLGRKGLVRRRQQRVVLGAVADVEAWEAHVAHRRWPELAPMLARTVFPRHDNAADTDRRVPTWLRHVFWNADVRRLDVERDAAYIAGRILASDDTQAHAWAAQTLSAHAFARAATVRGVDPRRAALARNLAAGA